MKQENAEDWIAINPTEGRGLTLRQENQAENQDQESYQDGCRTNKTLFLSHRTEDEISILFGNIFQFGLRTIQETFPCQSTGTDGNLGLIDVVSRTGQIFFQAQYYFDTDLLMGLQYAIEYIIAGI